jgi:hypothetical protein
MSFFVAMWLLLLVGWAVHTLVDRHPDRRTAPRVVELALLWLLVVGGAWTVLGGLSHLGPNSDRTAAGIGYAPSMFQWEVGWGDIAVGVLGIGCAWPRLRGSWLTAAVVALVISFGGDAVGHVMQLVAHDNRAPANLWALPSDVIQPLLAIGLLVAYRRTHRPAGDRAAAPWAARATTRR